MANEPMPEGLTNKDLECVMLDVPEFDIHAAYGPDLNKDDFYYGDPNGPLKYAQGPVAEKNAHVTLLFGIHPSETYQVDVLTLLETWDVEQILIKDVGFFPSTVEGEDYKAIVAHVVPSASLVAANKLLQTLPHTTNFPEYKPHITLAYIKGTADAGEWIPRMQAAFGHTFVTPWGLNLGDDDEEDD